MPPAGSDGEKVLSSGPSCARQRLPALIPLAPEPRHGGGHRIIGIHDRSHPEWQAIVLPMSVDRTLQGARQDRMFAKAGRGGIFIFCGCRTGHEKLYCK